MAASRSVTETCAPGCQAPGQRGRHVLSDSGQPRLLHSACTPSFPACEAGLRGYLSHRSWASPASKWTWGSQSYFCSGLSLPDYTQKGVSVWFQCAFNASHLLTLLTERWEAQSFRGQQFLARLRYQVQFAVFIFTVALCIWQVGTCVTVGIQFLYEIT